MTSAGRSKFAITLAIVKVFPEPVTPIRVCSFLPSFIARVSFSMACGWSPAGLKALSNLNIPIFGFSMENM